QVAVDDEDQIVELFARGQGDGAQRFRLVAFTVAEERPDLCIRARLQSAVLEVAHEARLVDRHDWAQPHRYGGVFPEVGHQPGVWVRRQAATVAHLTAEVLQLRLADSALEVRTRIDSGSGMTLKEDDVGVRAPMAAKEMIEPDLIERCRRGKGRDVT